MAPFKKKKKTVEPPKRLEVLKTSKVDGGSIKKRKKFRGKKKPKGESVPSLNGMYFYNIGDICYAGRYMTHFSHFSCS